MAEQPKPKPKARQQQQQQQPPALPTVNKKIPAFVVVGALIYAFYIQPFLFQVLGLGRGLDSLEDFPYTCRRLTHKQLEACEDIWLDHEQRILYAACAGSLGRGSWSPGNDLFDVQGRRKEGSELMALYIDEPAQDGLFRMHKIAPTGYSGATGDGTLDLLGFDAQVLSDSTTRFWLINQRPPVDEQGQYLDAKEVGANVTVDVFEHARGGKTMEHVKTIVDPALHSANGIIGYDDGSFIVSNDHSAQLGLRKWFDKFLGGGDLVNCPAKGPCNSITEKNLKLANGIVRGRDGLIYVPFTLDTGIKVYQHDNAGMLKQVKRIEIGMATDNLSVDKNGDIWAAGIPKLLPMAASFRNPLKVTVASAVFRIRRDEAGEYEVEKVLEDGGREVLSGATTAVHDVQTGRLFMGGATTPFMMVCDPK